MDCDTSVTPVACTYSCPSDQFFNSGGALTSTKKVTCNTATAEWSHMSASNPLGVLPSCSDKTDPTSYHLTAKIGLAGSDSCIDGLTAALQTALESSSDEAYNCMDNNQCAISGSAKCSSDSDGKLSLEFVVKQSGGDLKTSAIIDAFNTQLKTDAAAKTFTLTVGGKRRKTRATTLTADGTVVSTAESGCAAGSGTVGTSCIKCPAGEYEKDGVCTACAVNTYSDTVGSTKCIDCADSLKTITTGSDSVSDCLVTCTVKDVANGFRSPTIGYTVSEGTTLTTFCNSNYSLEYETTNKALCKTDTQPTCYKKCVIQSVDERATLQTTTLKAGSMLSYKEELKFTCSNKDKDMFNVQCAGAGNLYDISCPSKRI
ncbi:uncharacterized protein LOC134815418 [Bolinopsis microptera]|uniref:uncharacterized protein LOC134815418 n=1 Tax=Bolinopsis microptera TaxID=2820187 RepID=UPI0030793019